ncbi:hypothetical protein XENORESO_010816, partial [Xenotaenia resolanae]
QRDISALCSPPIPMVTGVEEGGCSNSGVFVTGSPQLSRFLAVPEEGSKSGSSNLNLIRRMSNSRTCTVL